MRFMMLMIPNIDESNWMPTPEAVASMTEYNAQLTKAGVLLALDGLQGTAEGPRVSFPGGKAAILDGPFTEAKEIIGGYWVIDVKSKQEAVEWAKRCPVASPDQVIEVRRIFELSDFPPEVQAAAGL